MAEKSKKSLLQVLKDAISTYQEQDVTEEEQEVLEDVEQSVEELEEKEKTPPSQEEDTVSEEPKKEETKVEPEEEPRADETYTMDEIQGKLDGLALSEESVKEASEFFVTLSKDTTDKLIPLLRKVLEETTVTSIQTLLQETKGKKPKTGAKKAPNSLGKEMAQVANQRKGK